MIRIAKTENGYVRGIEAADPRITAFKGIPFAAPPVGENRWRAPQPCEDWEGVLDTFRFKPISVQDTPGIGDLVYNREWHVDPDIEMSEDCLYLNVWTGAKSPEERLPVVIWYFGGALQWGYPSEMEFDGERVARRGVVVVSVNYRLNVFGFLAHPEITAAQPDAPTNFGSLDQQAGLNWVIRNIEAFGGDPNNITLAGQSAGGGSVMSQMVCPANFGKFQRAIVQSAMIRSPYDEGGLGAPQTLEEAEKCGETFFEICGVKTLEEARKLDALYIRAKYAEYAQTHPRMFPATDNKFAFGDPIKLFMENKRAQVPVMSGNTSEEFLSFIMAKDEAELKEKAIARFGEEAAEKFMSFAEAKRQMHEHQYAAVSGIECTVKAAFLKNEEYNNGTDCYYYNFDPEIPGWDHPGTFHSVELWFFFETLAKCWRPFKGQHYDLARMMCNYWCNFIKTGNPNGEDCDGAMMPVWKPYTKEHPSSMVFRTEGPCPENRTEEKPFQAFLIDQITKQTLSK